MKRLLAIVLVCGVTGWSRAQTITTNYTLTPDTGIPVGDPVGLTETFNVGDLSGTIANIQVSLDITGGFNGDLYAYLAGPQGGFAVLLNRAGVNGGNAFGYADAGFNITLDDSGSYNNIHYYQTEAGSGVPTGTWASDGENVDPQSSQVGAFSGPTANLLSFDDLGANGMWTFFIADMSSGGGTPSLNSLTLTIMTVPEPQTWVLVVFGLLVLGRIARVKRLKGISSRR